MHENGSPERAALAKYRALLEAAAPAAKSLPADDPIMMFGGIIGQFLTQMEEIERSMQQQLQDADVNKLHAEFDAGLAHVRDTLAWELQRFDTRIQEQTKALTKEVKESASMAHEEDWRMLWQMYWMAAISVFMGLGTAFLNVSHLLWR